MYILDCTLRDGGYYNNWDFDLKTVNAYLQAMALANIEYVELGLRNFPQKQFFGPFAYTTEHYLNNLELPSGPTYGVMIDAKTILQSGMPIQEAVDKLFIEKNNSKIGLVRIAAHFSEVNESKAIAKAIKAKGYLIGFNLMQSGGKPAELISATSAEISSWDCIDVLYFADSLGNMDADEVKRIIGALKKCWHGELGIHTHNNMGKALDNALQANKLNVTWLDVTVTGMGRGAGNAQTENLLAFLSKKPTAYNAAPVYDLAIRHFDKMQKKCGWGSNLLYFVGAQYNVHPTYIQNLLSDERYGPDEIVGAIDYLSKNEASSYNGVIMEQALNLNRYNLPISGDSRLVGLFDGKDVLIIGNGTSVELYQKDISDYIKTYQPVVLSININKNISESFVDFYVVSHNTKFLAEKNKYHEVRKPFIMPRHRFSDDEIRDIGRNVDIYDYGLTVESGVFEPKDTYCTIPSELTAGYALAVAIISKPRSIKLIGFDGYQKGDERQQEMIDLIMTVHEQHYDGKLESLTPTSYPLKKGSVYAPYI